MRRRSFWSSIPSFLDRAVSRRPNIEKLKANRDLRGLTNALGSTSSTATMQAAAQAVGQVASELQDPAAASRVVEPLIAALSHDEWRVRQAAAEAG